MKEKLFSYLQDKFPNLQHKIHLRFELGEPFDNGTDERINQVYYRVTRIFESIFKKEDKVYLLVKDWKTEDIMFGNLTPNYLYNLLGNMTIETETIAEVVEDEYPLGNLELTETKVKESILFSEIRQIDYKNILRGIANYEQGREPSIGQRVYFISQVKDIIFYMYDDRGCIIFSDNTEKIRFLYEKYNDWIVEYWRETINEIFSNT